MLDATGAFARKFVAQLGRPLTRSRTRTLQVNLGKRCNMACHHCHVEAGPKRTEIMSAAVADRIIDLVTCNPAIDTVDLTGGAPELNPNFRRLVEQVRKVGRRVIDRCNLTVLFEPGMSDLAEFQAQQGVEIVASLPCYSAANVEKQRGQGAFDKSIEALLLLNRLGYGLAGSRLKLDLVYNPVGASLPPEQSSLERTYKDELSELYGVQFHHLLTITNMPIKRFAQQLARENKQDEYMALLVHHFNASTVDELMCRSLVSVSWDGRLHDCDFNQMLELPLGAGPATIWDIDTLDDLTEAEVATGGHCFGCTAGAGSSCSGAIR